MVRAHRRAMVASARGDDPAGSARRRGRDGRRRAAWWWWATPIGNLGDLSPARRRGAARGRRGGLRGHPPHGRRCCATPSSRRRWSRVHRHNEAARAAELVARMRGGSARRAGQRRRDAAGERSGRAPGARRGRRRAAGHRGPGPSAVTTALARPGLGGRRAVRVRWASFPAGAAERRALMRAPRGLDVPSSPSRARAALPALLADWRRPARSGRSRVCRELTKLHEEVCAAPPPRCGSRPGAPRGEITLVIGAGQPAEAPGEDGLRARPRAADGRRPGRRPGGRGRRRRSGPRRATGPTGRARPAEERRQAT